MSLTWKHPILWIIAWMVPAFSAQAAEYDANPDTYRTLLPTLQPGDILNLQPGTYPTLLNISGLNGTASDWIIIRGPATGAPAVFTADPGPCCNTVEIRNSSYVALENLTIDGNGVDGAFGISAKDGTSNLVHHIRIEGCTLINHDASQQTVAVSTKTPTWGWIIRRNKILRAGTGLYLGNSDGTSPFVAGVIEENLFVDTLGYNMQIKWQQPRPTVEGMPTGPSSTLIRNNVFIKADRPSPDGDRPNVLVGGFPDSGAGAEDLYEIYGNFFFHNPREALLQASGRVSIHDNVFVDSAGTAIVLQNHDLPLRLAHVYNNTIYGAAFGLSVGGTMDQGVIVVGNLVFADTGLSGTPTTAADNLFATVTEAATYVAAPSLALGVMDFFPLPGTCEGTPLDLSAFTDQVAWDLDFNGQSKGSHTFRGAYAGSGTNPGWQLDEALKEMGTASCGDGVIDPGEQCDDGNTIDGDGCSAICGLEESTTTNDDGCSCAAGARASGSFPYAGVLPMLLILLLRPGRRRRLQN